MSMLNIKAYVGSNLIKPVCQKAKCHILIWESGVGEMPFSIYLLSNKDV